MRPQDEIRKDKRLLFKADKHDIELQLRAKAAIEGGYITLSNGRKGSFVMGRDEEGWEHVSVQLYHKLPTWEEMCEVKEIFWEDEEEAVQIHPKKSEYINMTEALHIWRPKDGDWSRMNKEAEDAESEDKT